jgi:hypothetical protein
MLILAMAFLCSHQSVTGQDTLRKRLPWVIAGETAVVGGGAVTVYQLWYKQYSSGKFHFFNDNPEWEGMDKCGHAYTSFYLGAGGYKLMRFAGLPHRKAIWWGATQGSAMLLIMEVMDGFSAGWGFSPGDIWANAGGTLLYGGQQLLWNEVRIHPKISFSRSQYAALRPDLLGDGLVSELFKDYNGQVYWLSAAPFAFFENDLPAWLKPASLAIGYSAEGMVSGRRTDVPAGLEHLNRHGEVFVSLDVDWARIPVKNKHLKNALKVLNAVKLPFPGLVFAPGGVKLRGLVY